MCCGIYLGDRNIVTIKGHASGKNTLLLLSHFFGESSDLQKPTSSQQHKTISTPKIL